MNRDLIMIIEDVFDITGRGVVAVGQIKNKTVYIGDEVIIDPEFTSTIKAEIKQIESFRKMLKFAEPDQNVGLVLKGVQKKDVRKKMKIYIESNE